MGSEIPPPKKFWAWIPPTRCLRQSRDPILRGVEGLVFIRKPAHGKNSGTNGLTPTNASITLSTGKETGEGQTNIQ